MYTTVILYNDYVKGELYLTLDSHNRADRA
jgi:hypothetical protein